MGEGVKKTLAVATGIHLISLVAMPARAEGDITPFPLVRLATGVRIPINDDPRVDGGFAMDGSFGVSLALAKHRRSPIDTTPHPELHLSPHLGLTTEPGILAFSLGMGVGGGISMLSVAYEPKLLAGRWEDPITKEDFPLVGMRNSGTLGLFFGILSFEAGHELDCYAGAIHPSAIVMGRLDLGALFPLIIIGVMSGMN
jgi:hypothetical protein